MNEHEIIGNLKKIIKNPNALKLNDDVFFDKKKSLMVSIDTYNEKVHYLNFLNPDLIVKKIIRSSISDIISKGADPKYLLLSFSCPKKYLKKKKIKLLVKSINEEQKKFKFSLVGGDTSVSTKSSFTACVFSYSNKIVKRTNCKTNDDIYLTGNIGDSSVGLYLLKKKIRTDIKLRSYFLSKFFKPDLPFGFHKELYKFANSSMDISDGLLVDIKKLIGDKNLGFVIDFNLLPKSNFLKKLNNQNKISLHEHLFSGDDYQILFTANSKFRKKIIKYANTWNQKITRIGKILNERGDYLKFNNKLKKINNYQGYIHNFS